MEVGQEKQRKKKLVLFKSANSDIAIIDLLISVTTSMSSRIQTPDRAMWYGGGCGGSGGELFCYVIPSKIPESVGR